VPVLIWVLFVILLFKQGVPVLIGVGVVAVTAILAKMFLFGNKKKAKSPITLQDPNIKYPLKLVDKEVNLQHLYS
jgi:hypothetical protein